MGLDLYIHGKREKRYRNTVPFFIQTFTQKPKLGHFLINICDALRGLVAFVQFKKCEKHPYPWRSVRLQPATLLKSTLLHGCFLNCTNGTKSRNAPPISKMTQIWCELSKYNKTMKFILHYFLSQT